MKKKEAATIAWLRQLGCVLHDGREVAPRGQATLELKDCVIEYDARNPVVCVPERGLSRVFLAAEPLWILSGSDRLEDIAPYNPKMRDYSDDGDSLFGAYGPPIARQLGHVVARLVEDQSSRQAALTIWRENPPPSLDVPCTLGMAFSIRDRVISSSVFMRSSDVWLGLPYDMMTFAAVLYRVASEVSEELGGGSYPLELGAVAIHAASSHLYLKNADVARSVVDGKPDGEMIQRALDDLEKAQLPPKVYGMENYRRFEAELTRARDAKVLPWFSKL